MIKPIITIVALSAGLSFSAWAAEAKEGVEEKVSLEKIPPPAAKTLKEHAGDAKITNLSREKDEGKIVFEASFKRNGRAHDVTVDEHGKLISDEEVVPLSEAPEPVRTSLEKEHPGGKIEKFERIKEGRNVSYEALISSKGKREEIKVDSEGKVLEREDKTHDKDKD